MDEYITKNQALDIIKIPLAVFMKRNVTNAISSVREIVTKIDDVAAADVRENKRGKWFDNGKFRVVNLETANEQYAELGYPHRNIRRIICSECRKVTCLDETIKYNYCPHCGAEMQEGEQ